MLTCIYVKYLGILIYFIFICFKAHLIEILQRSFLIWKHFNLTCISGANSIFLRKGMGALAYLPPSHESYVLRSIIIYYSQFTNEKTKHYFLLLGLKMTFMLWSMSLLDASVNLDLFVQCPSRICEGAQQTRARLNHENEKNLCELAHVK